MQIESLDITAAIIQLLEYKVLVVSVYVLGVNPQVLQDLYNNLRKAIYNMKCNIGTVVDIVIARDFNCYNQL